MSEFDEVCLEYFLAHQEQLLPSPNKISLNPFYPLIQNGNKQCPQK